MRNLFTYMRVLLAVYLASYFLLNPIFLHTHEIDGESIVHSHPVKGTSHTASAAKIIKYFNGTQLVETAQMQNFTRINVFICEVCTPFVEHCGFNPIHSKGQRAPPVM